MAIDTFIAYCGVYADAEGALADYAAIHDLHSEVGLIDAYDAAVIERNADGKVKIIKKHETPTRVGGVLGGGVGLANLDWSSPCSPQPPSEVVSSSQPAREGAILGSVAGHAAAGMSRSDLKELGGDPLRWRSGPCGRRCLGHGGEGHGGNEASSKGRGQGVEGRPEGNRRRSEDGVIVGPNGSSERCRLRGRSA